MEKQIILLNILGSLAALSTSAAAILFAEEKLYKHKLSRLRTAGSVCDVYLAAGGLVLLFGFLMTGRMPELRLSDTGLRMTVMTTALTAVWLTVLAAGVYVYRRNKKLFSANIVILAVLLLLVLILFFARLRAIWILSETVNQETYLPFLFLAFLAMNGAVFLMVNQAQNEAAEKEMADARHQAELERIHFERVEESRRELNTIRSDYDALLAQAHTLIESNQADQAKQLLNGLFERIESTKEAPFCPIAAVNAILEAKKQECDQEHIGLDVELMLPGKLPVKDLDLCMALGNQLDNAIRECKKASDMLEKPQIRLTGKVVQGYLVLRCVNPVYFEEQRGPEGTGYGLKILKDIADRYHGDFFTRRECGSFISQLSLCVLR
ncbi:MAG: GHKL domain-containing protein [Lachnospiraceae bacterium]|nr:GHKL domain-containing protein [Lachnospiraceae bacterium]